MFRCCMGGDKGGAAGGEEANRDTIDEANAAPAQPTERAEAPTAGSPRSAPRAPPGSGLLKRADIRSLPLAEQERVCDALDEMVRTGEYFRLASYHGWPNEFCAHNEEHFPVWHRGYLVEFERALSQADRSLGRDGSIGLPYWDGGQPVVNGETLPAVLRRRWGTLPSQLRDQIARHPQAAGAARLLETGYALHGEARVRQGIAPMAQRYALCLLEAEHWRHASNRFSGRAGGVSLEDPHNTGHVALGFPMTSVGFAAFHPIFFMHHCQVDRVYESYLRTEPDSAAEFAATQAMLQEQNAEGNRFVAPLEPFSHPRTGAQLVPADCFDARALGFEYDALLAPPPVERQLRERPTLVLLPAVTKGMTNFRSFQLHAFVVPAAEAAAFHPPAAAEGVELWAQHPAYGGTGAHFGGKGAECANCLDAKPFDITIDVSDAVRRARTPRSELVAVVLALGEDGELSRAEHVGLPAPRLVGPTFESEAPIALGAHGADVAAAQRLLHKLGFAEVCGRVDGELGPHMAAALKLYQRSHGLERSGALDAAVRASLVRTRFDLHSELPGEDDTPRRTPQGELLSEAARVPYHVGVSPGYLPRARALEEITSAFAQWADAGGVKFVRVAERADALIVVEWSDNTRQNELRFDGPGGALAIVDVPSGAQAGPQPAPWHLTLDASERWTLQGEPEPRPGSFVLLPVVLHEVGHLLGLAHSAATADEVMSPYYEPGRVRLSARDRARAHALQSPQRFSR